MNMRNLYLFFLTIPFAFISPCHAMEKESHSSQELRPLNWIEREIFINEIQKPNGINIIKQQLKLMKKSKEPIIIDLALYPNHRNNVLIKMIHEAIKLKEKKAPYRPNINKTNDPACEKNNFLGEYTEYWHVADLQGKNYIRCLAIFKQPEVLKDIFKEIENAHEQERKRTLLLIQKTYSLT